MILRFRLFGTGASRGFAFDDFHFATNAAAETTGSAISFVMLLLKRRNPRTNQSCWSKSPTVPSLPLDLSRRHRRRQLLSDRCLPSQV